MKAAVSLTIDPADPGEDDRPWDAVELSRRAGRLILIGGLVWAGWTAARAWSELLSPPRARPTSAEVVPEPAPSALVQMDFAGGRWLLGEGSRPIAFARLPAIEAAERVLALSGADADGRGAGTDLVPLIRAVSGKGTADGPGTVYTAKKPGLILKAVTRGAGAREELAAARLALRWGGGGEWLVFETTEGASPTAPHGGTDGLLACPRSARRLAARYDRAGRVLGEVVTVEAAPDELPAAWRSKGWSVAGVPVPGRELGPPWSCRRGDDAVHVWAIDSTDARGPLVLVLIRDPTSDGGPTR